MSHDIRIKLHNDPSAVERVQTITRDTIDREEMEAPVKAFMHVKDKYTQGDGRSGRASYR